MPTSILEGWRQFEAVARDYLTPIASEDQHERALEGSWLDSRVGQTC